jgi:hypothetical protein
MLWHLLTNLEHHTLLYMDASDNHFQYLIHSTVNNFVDWSHIGTVMHCSGYVEPRDGAVSFLLLSQQEAVACVWCIQKKSHCSEG